MDETKRRIREGILPNVQRGPTECTVWFQSKYRKMYEGRLSRAKTVDDAQIDTKENLEGLRWRTHVLSDQCGLYLQVHWYRPDQEENLIRQGRD